MSENPGVRFMYVCICNAVTDRAIREAAESGAESFDDVRRETGCGDCCGNCEDLASEIFHEAVASRSLGIAIIAKAA